MLHQDSAPAHNALSVKKFLPDKRIPILQHPPNLRIWHPVIFSFLQNESVLKGTQFPSVDEVKAKNGTATEQPRG